MSTFAQRRPRAGVVARIIIVVASLAVIFVGIKPVLWPDYQSSKIASTAPPAITPPAPTEQASPEPRRRWSPAPTPPVIEDPEGLPETLEIFEGKRRLLAMNIAKKGTTQGDPFKSECGQMTWYAAHMWPTPGSLSPRKSLVTGHGWCRGEVYELDKLRKSSKEATLRITYDSGDEVVAEATMAAGLIDKTKLNKIHDNLYNYGDERMIRVSTCDSTSDKRPDGHAEGNVFQMFQVVAVIKK